MRVFEYDRLCHRKKKEEERKEMQNASSMTSGINYIISRSIEREYTVYDEAYVR